MFCRLFECGHSKQQEAHFDIRLLNLWIAHSEQSHLKAFLMRPQPVYLRHHRSIDSPKCVGWVSWNHTQAPDTSISNGLIDLQFYLFIKLDVVPKSWELYMLINWYIIFLYMMYLHVFTHVYMGVSENSVTPKSSILIGFSIINHPFWGTPFLETPTWPLRCYQ